MAAPKRSSIQRENDLPKIAKQYLQGIPQARIAKELGISQPQICADLKVIRSRWRESSIRDFDVAKSEELAKIDLVETQAWEAWEESKKLKTTTTKKTGTTPKGDVDLIDRKAEKQVGNPVFLNVVMSCITKRCQIMGLDSELKAADLNAAIGAVIRAGFKVESAIEDTAERDETEVV